MNKPEFDPELVFAELKSGDPQQELTDMKVTFSDIKTLYRQPLPDTVWHPFPESVLEGRRAAEYYCYFIGFDRRTSRFVLVSLTYETDEERLYFLRVKIADVQEIREKWCPFQSFQRSESR